jgi:transcription termination factor NusA
VTFDEKVARAVGILAQVDGINKEQAEKLVQSGFLTIDGITAAEKADLEAIEGFDSETVKSVYEAAAAHVKKLMEEAEPHEGA